MSLCEMGWPTEHEEAVPGQQPRLQGPSVPCDVRCAVLRIKGLGRPSFHRVPMVTVHSRFSLLPNSENMGMWLFPELSTPALLVTSFCRLSQVYLSTEELIVCVCVRLGSLHCAGGPWLPPAVGRPWSAQCPPRCLPSSCSCAGCCPSPPVSMWVARSALAV